MIAIYLLNVSVDTADPHPEHISEDLTINDQESIIEIIVEQVLGYEDAIKEYDDHDTEDHNQKKNIKIDLITRYLTDNRNNHLPLEIVKQEFPDFRISLINGFHQLDTPPPKV